MSWFVGSNGESKNLDVLWKLMTTSESDSRTTYSRNEQV